MTIVIMITVVLALNFKYLYISSFSELFRVIPERFASLSNSKEFEQITVAFLKSPFSHWFSFELPESLAVHSPTSIFCYICQ